jgi:hypothetical protein
VAARKASARPKPSTKAQTHQTLAGATGLSKPQVAAFFEELTKLIQRELSKKGPGEFELPGLLKIRRTDQPGTRALRVVDPSTGKTFVIPGIPRQAVVKARALKGLKDLVL